MNSDFSTLNFWGSKYHLSSFRGFAKGSLILKTQWIPAWKMAFWCNLRPVFGAKKIDHKNPGDNWEASSDASAAAEYSS